MKCLSIRQPFAELILSGRKTIELRNWSTSFRGWFLIHASGRADATACKAFGIDPEAVPRGAIAGKAFLYDVKEYGNDREFALDRSRHLAAGGYPRQRYGFMLKGAERLARPAGMRGRLGFFEVEWARGESNSDL